MKRLNRKGFTLVEVMVAAVLLTTVAAGLLSAFIAARNWIQPQRIIAMHLAKEMPESLFEFVWASPRLMNGYVWGDVVVLDGSTYTRGYTVSNVAGRDYRTVTATVTW